MNRQSDPRLAPSEVESSIPPVASRRVRWVVLGAAFFGWLFAGVQMSITPLVSNSATTNFLGKPADDAASKQAFKPTLTKWFARYNATFLLGAACGGLLFGWFGDRFGRTKALGLSICCYSLFSALAGFATTPEAFIVLRFIGCLGVGGAWPNGIALAAESWSDVSKPVLAGVIGTAANVGLVLMGLVAVFQNITPDSWRWVMFLGGIPFIVGVATLAFVRESPKWLLARSQLKRPVTPVREVFRPPLLKLTLLGIILGAVPLFGGWGCTNWLVPWADQVGATSDPKLKAWTQVYRSAGAAVTSLLGGWVAASMGRKTSYLLFSLSSLLIGQYIFRSLNPTHPNFQLFVLFMGTTTGFYFGWLPLCLPELFPTRVRSTGEA